MQRRAHRITPDDWIAQPWKNGAGITYEIARWGAIVGDANDFTVRISMAVIERSGPFSLFVGCNRWSFLAGDAPIELGIAGMRYRLTAIGDNLEYLGSEMVEASVTAPTHLLNVIAADASVSVGRNAPLHGAAARFAIALIDTPELPRWHALRDPETVPPGCVWVS